MGLRRHRVQGPDEPYLTELGLPKTFSSSVASGVSEVLRECESQQVKRRFRKSLVL